MKRTRLHLLILICAVAFLSGCQKYPENPNRPILPYPTRINLSEYQYHNLRLAGGWEYITAPVESASRGFIVFHVPNADNLDNEFVAYDRMPPNYPDACTDSQGNTNRLVVEWPFVVDHCNNAYYNILNSEIFIAEPDMIPNFLTDGVAVYPLIQYHTTFDGNQLVIYN